MAVATDTQPVARVSVKPAEWRAFRVRAAELGIPVSELLALIVRRELAQPVAETES